MYLAHFGMDPTSVLDVILIRLLECFVLSIYLSRVYTHKYVYIYIYGVLIYVRKIMYVYNYPKSPPKEAKGQIRGTCSAPSSRLDKPFTCEKTKSLNSKP